MDIKLSTLPTVTSAVAGDLFPFTQVAGPATKGITLANIKISLGLGNVENTAVSTWTGTASITTLGTITTGTWHGTAITDAYIASATTWNAAASALAGKEPALGNPSVDGYVLSSLIDGTRSWIVPSSGGGAPSGAAGGDLSGTYPNPSVQRQLPAWSFGAVATLPEVGEFGTDNASIESTTVIFVSKTDDSGTDTDDLLKYLYDEFRQFIIFTNTNGKTAYFEVAGASDGGTYFSLQVALVGGSGSWAGKYSVSYGVRVSREGAVQAEGGWVANGSTGDKTVAIPNYAESDFSGADETVSLSKLTTLGQQVAAITSKLQALQDTLSRRFLPND